MLSGIELVANELGFERRASVELTRSRNWCTTLLSTTESTRDKVCLHQIRLPTHKRNLSDRSKYGMAFQSAMGLCAPHNAHYKM